MIAVVVAAARLLWCSQFPFSRLGICFPRTDIPRSCSQNAFVMLVGSCVCNGGEETPLMVGVADNGKIRRLKWRKKATNFHDTAGDVSLCLLVSQIIALKDNEN